MYMTYVWLTVLCVGMLIESINAGTLVTIWFSVGAIIPLIMSLFKITTVTYITIQFVVFGVVTLLCLIFLRKIAKKLLFKNSKDKTNLDLYLGKEFTIIKNMEILLTLNLTVLNIQHFLKMQMKLTTLKLMIKLK